MPVELKLVCNLVFQVGSSKDEKISTQPSLKNNKQSTVIYLIFNVTRALQNHTSRP